MTLKSARIAGRTIVVLAAILMAVPAQFGTQAQAAVDPGTQLWVGRYNNSTDGFVATSVAVSPDGNKVYVTGSNNVGATYKFVTVAYDTAGNQLWATPFAVTAGDKPDKVAVSPDGKTVYVGGFVGSPSNADYQTIAYDAATGNQKWARTYNGPANGNDQAMGLAVNQSTGNIYVTGGTPAAAGGSQFTTVAYSPSGTQLWVQNFSDSAPAQDYATSVAVNSVTGVVYVTGQSGFNNKNEYATEAISATGNKLWVKHYSGTGNGSTAWAVAVNPSTGDVFVTGQSNGGSTSFDYATVAYSSSGTLLWAKRYARAGTGSDIATSVAVNASGSAVYVTGRSLAPNNQYDYVTVAYSSTGVKQWLRTYNGPAGANADDQAVGVAVNHSTGSVYVTGESYNNDHLGYDYATIAYSAVGGTPLWTSRYAAASAINNRPQALAINPVSGDVYVTGTSGNSHGEYDYATVAYAP